MEDTTAELDAAPADSEAPASVDSQPASQPSDAGAAYAPAPAAAPATIDYQALAQAVAAAHQPPPPPQKNPWDDPGFYKLAVPEEQLHGEFHGRLGQHVTGVVDSKLAQFGPAVKQYVDQVLEREREEMRARYAMDPAFAKVEAIYEQLKKEGVPAKHARELANARVGVGKVPTPAAAPRVPAAPAHASATPSRPAPAQPRDQLGKWTNLYDKKERLARFNAIADRLGFPD